MSVRVVNGKVTLDRKPKALDAPTPAQIAERAYDLAIEVAANHNASHPCTSWVHDEIREAMSKAKAETLAALRESVVKPGVLPWWRKPT